MTRVRALLADPRRRKNVLVVLLLVLAINLPLAPARRGTTTGSPAPARTCSAEVTKTRNLGTDAEPHWWVSWRFPRAVDPDGGTWAAEVDRDSWTTARDTGSITVRVLEGSPSRHTATGEVRRYAGLWTTLVADALLLLALAWVWGPIRSRRDSEGHP